MEEANSSVSLISEIEKRFCAEILYHCTCIIELHKMLNLFYNSSPIESDYRRALLGFTGNAFTRFALESIVEHAGFISKILFPADKKGKLRGSNLRKTLKIKDNSAFRDREVRNAIQHADERIDIYANILKRIQNKEIKTMKLINKELRFVKSTLGYSRNGFSIQRYARKISFTQGGKIIKETMHIKKKIHILFPDLEAI